MKKLRDILQGIEPKYVDGNLDVEITGIVYDSRKVQSGSLFVCIEGYTTDGHRYVEQARLNGAAALIIEKEITYPDGLTVIRVANSRLALAQAASAFYEYPAEKLNLIGVTGTNGKTTITYLLSAILQHVGKKTGLIGTINNFIGEEVIPSEHTTPESSDLQKLLFQMAAAGVHDVIMEVSSHALDLERIAMLRFHGAIFTNLTQDHLDFHKTMEDYFAAKSKLFEAYQHANRINIINCDDAYGEKIVSIAVGRTYTYGINNFRADFRAEGIKLLKDGISYRIVFAEGEINLKLKLLGEFNVYNSLAAAAYAIASGVDPLTVKEALESAKGVPGRFEIIDAGQPFIVTVDYAHTPDGLENIISSARKFTLGKIITVFGCGGDRDRTKRPKMGQISACLSDNVIITSDNPRSEDPQDIIDQICAGISEPLNNKCQIEIDRSKAIKLALEQAIPGDIVIIAGKGHEDYQIIKDKTLHFDDRQEALKWLRGMGYEN